MRSTPICKTISAFVRCCSARIRELSKPLFGSYKVLIGRGGRMFFLGNEMVDESAGLVMRDRAVGQLADLLARMNDDLRARGIRFLVAPPPSSSSVYQDDLPIWAQNAGPADRIRSVSGGPRRERRASCRFAPAVKAARAGGSVYYLHDTHWTFRGALAGFNAVVEADSHPDWRIDPSSALGPPVVRKGGDMANILGLSDKLSE